MSIAQGNIITADDVYLQNLTKETVCNSISVPGRAFVPREASGSYYFWIRWEEPDEWAAGTTYSEDDYTTVIDGSTVLVFRSLTDANTGNDPELDILEADWTQIGTYEYSSDTYVSPIRFETKGKGILGDLGDNALIELYEITWDVSGEEVENHVATFLRTGLSGDTAYQDYYAGSAGYYRVDIDVSSQGTGSKTSVSTNCKQGDTSILRGKQVRIFRDDHQALNEFGTTLATSIRAGQSLFGTADYAGGDYEGI